MSKEVFDEFEHVDIVVNNAGLAIFGSVRDLSMEELEEQITTNLLGAIYASLEDRNAARAAFAAALRLDPRDASIYTNLGLLELASANRPAAAGYLREALSLDPRSNAARRGLAQVRHESVE